MAIERCPVCPAKYLPIHGDGPQPAPILLIGERPGGDENKRHQVFVGKTGMELDLTYLPLAGLHREDVRICNSVLCWADGNRTPTDKEVQGCTGCFLPRELEATCPEIVVLMGGRACSLVPDIKLEIHHGRPRRASLMGWSGWIVPMYHPAIGLHEGRWMTQLLEDWEYLGYWAPRERHWTQFPIIEPPKFKLVERAEDLHEYFSGYPIAVDTENHGPSPYSIQISPVAVDSGRGGISGMVLASNKQVIGLAGEYLRDRTVCLHKADHDLDVMEQMGIRHGYYRDTMQEAFHQGNLPQGLKALTYRLFGQEMTSWEDVVWPASINALLDWLVEAMLVARQDLCVIERVQLKTKVRETVKRGPMEALCTRLIQHSRPASEYDPWERLTAYWLDEANDRYIAHVEARIGHYPILGIGNCSIPQAVSYACSDAYWTGRVAVELERRRNSGLYRIADGDWDWRER